MPEDLIENLVKIKKFWDNNSKGVWSPNLSFKEDELTDTIHDLKIILKFLSIIHAGKYDETDFEQLPVFKTKNKIK
ncbi:MAG: hypothetical protein CMF23_14510 [Ignavibacteriae bacterium]|nr:hypothetical protein [Ignavibacteriota bacterium]